MSWFQLGAEELAARARASRPARAVPSMGESIARGAIGFTIVSVAGFAPWAFAGLNLSRWIGEAGLYAVCATVFIVLSGPLLHRLIIGRGSLSRFYKLFGIAFAAYALAWTVGWMSLGGNRGSMAGLLFGTGVMGVIMAAAFDARSAAWKVILVLFIGNAVGYFSGSWLVDALSATPTPPIVDRLAWGICYGIGFGAGLGLAFYFCQALARDCLRPTT